jgi:pimeloyl-ACP methyl ester carboxylesterase
MPIVTDLYDHRLRPQQPATPSPDAFTIHRAAVDGELSLGFVREGVGGYPLLLIHGYPESKRIWWRNIEALGAAGYEVVVPDLRGYGESDLSAEDVYDLASYSRDCHTLMTSGLGHDRFGVVAGDIGGAVAVDLTHRFPSAVDKLVYFNTVPPILLDDFVAAGIDLTTIKAMGDGPTTDYQVDQGERADALIEELDTPEKRERWVRGFYTHRLLASPGAFTDEDLAFMTEPFRDRDRLRSAWAPYEARYGRAQSEPPLMSDFVDIPTLLLYGPDDHVVGPDFIHCCEVAFRNRVGPVVVPGAGHFLQWERADILNGLVAAFFADMRT